MKRCTNVMQSMKSHWHGIWLLKQSIIINIWFNYMKRLFFYYSRYPHDIRMKYCGCGWGCGCQNSCGYPRMRIRMRSSDTPLIFMSKYFKKNNEKSARSHPRLRKNASRLLALTTTTTTTRTTTAILISPFRTS